MTRNLRVAARSVVGANGWGRRKPVRSQRPARRAMLKSTVMTREGRGDAERGEASVRVSWAASPQTLLRA